MRIFPFLLLLLAPPSQAALPPELKEFLGPAPKSFEAQYLRPARQLKSALEKLQNGKKEAAIKELNPLAKSGAMAEHAGFELARALQEKKQFAQSTSLINRLNYEFPNSPYREELVDLLQENDCQQGLAESAKGAKAQGAITLQRCLQRLTWREWSEREKETTALYEILKSSKDPLFGSFLAELIQALPPSAPLRVRLQKEIPDLQKYAEMPRFRTRGGTPAGVKPVNPDLELFNQGMQEVLEGKWSSAKEFFLRVEAEFPQSEHMDRALYWIARSEEALNNLDEAHQRYEQIYVDYPLSYYGLQSALRLKKDLSQFILPATSKPEPMNGTPLPRQMVSLWKIRALLEQGLIDPARAEAKALFQYRPGGSTFGQESPAGAALAGLLFHTAGYSMAAFSHAYAAISLDPTLLNTSTLELIFPSTYSVAFKAAADSSGVNSLLLYSVAKQESAFLPNAVSRANALGLMQLLLSTARDMEPKLERTQLFDPRTNTRLGSRYLQQLLARFNGNIPLALAGYNAGPSRAAQWQKRMNEFDGMRGQFDVDTFIDTIPFTETRRYVSSILRNYAWYKLLNKDGKVENVEELAFQWQKNKLENLKVDPKPIEPTPPSPPPTPSTSPEAAAI
jgi:soluble lytic murein transglycosylase-like protein